VTTKDPQRKWAAGASVSPLRTGVFISRKALGRDDLDRTRLSAEVYERWPPSTQCSIGLRAGTKCLRDTAAEYLKFVASTDDSTATFWQDTGV
jgi:hypothetical protein